jgi:AmmeMemoRadiSam system protein B
MKNVRPSPIAGTWYPSDPDRLRDSIDTFLEQAPEIPLEGEIVGVIVPHAGHRYSGGVAAHAFRLLRGASPKVVAVLSPFHQPHPAPILSTNHIAYQTPLGEIEVASDLLDDLERELAAEEIYLQRIPHDQEHALEIELPFLQRSLKDPFRMIPLMLRDQSLDTALALGHALAAILPAGEFLLVASTDLSHFYPASTAQKLDAAMLDAIETFDPRMPIQVEMEGKGFACGRGAVTASLTAAKELGANKVRILHYAHSGLITGDTSSVVGYGSGVILKETDLSAVHASQ